jgi:regulator of replication initiation timing
LPEIYIREQDKIRAAIQRLERRTLSLERENETLRKRLGDLELKKVAAPRKKKE